MGSLVAELAEKLSSATNSIDFDEQTLFLNTSANTVGVGTNAPASKFDVRGTMQVGIDGTGYDVKFFGDTASAYMLWDESADDLVLAGVAGINVSGTGTITGTLATVAQANITSLGTLTTLTVDSIIINGTNIGHTSDTNAIAISSAGVVTMDQIPVFSAGINVSGGTIAGTLATAAQANITSLGTISISGVLKSNGGVVFNEDSADVDFRVESNGNANMLFVDGGNDRVGIGTAAPNQNLDVLSTAQITGAEGTSASLYMVADEGDDNGDGWRITSNQDANDLTISNNTSGSYVDKVTFLKTGLVGIGTTAPVNLLHCESTNEVVGSLAGQIRVSTSDSIAIDKGGQIVLGGVYTGSAISMFGSIAGRKENSSDGNYAGYLQFGARTHGASIAEHMRISSTGKVGIGTTAPNEELHIEATNPGLRLKGTATDGRVDIYLQGDTKIWDIKNDADTFYIRNDTDGVTGLLIDSAGRMLRPVQPAFSVKPSNDSQNLNPSNASTVNFNTELNDIGANFASHVFTAPASGMYSFSVYIRINAQTQNSYAYVQLATSNASFEIDLSSTAHWDTSTVDYGTKTGSLLAYMDASDTAEVKWNIVSGSNPTGISSASWFMGFLVG